MAMATQQENGDSCKIDIWCSTDVPEILDEVLKQLNRIFSWVNTHDITNFAEEKGVSGVNGAILVIVSPKVLQIAPSFIEIKSNRVYRYYVDQDDLLANHNIRVSLLGADPNCIWVKVDIQCDDPKILQGAYRQIVHNAISGTTAIAAPRKKKPPTSRRGAFTVIPKEFQYGAVKKVQQNAEFLPDGSIIVDPENLNWKFHGESVTAYLVNQEDKSKLIPMTVCTVVPAKVYSFKLPDNLKPGSYMVHVRDGDGDNAPELGNRRITVFSTMLYISSNLFSEENLAALSKVPDFSSKENLDKADKALSACFERSQLPLLLPQYLGRKFPTLLHVACYYSFNTLFAKIMDSFSSLEYLNIANVDLQTPGQMAKEQGHHILTELLANQLEIQNMYVKHAPAETRDFYDMYSTVSFDKEDTDSGYVTGAQAIYDTEPNDIYDLALEPAQRAQHDSHRASSVRERPLSPAVQPVPQSRTLPRDFHSNHSHYQSEDRREEVSTRRAKPKAPAQEPLFELSDKHIQDWTKRMKSLKRLGLRERLQYQQELRRDMYEQYNPPTLNPPKPNKPVEPRKPKPPVQPSDSNTSAQDSEPPTIVPRKVSTPLVTTPSPSSAPASSNGKSKPAKRLPAPPPSQQAAELQRKTSDAPIVRPRPIHPIQRSNSVDESDYLLPESTTPAPRPRDLQRNTSADKVDHVLVISRTSPVTAVAPRAALPADSAYVNGDESRAELTSAPPVLRRKK